MGIYPINQIGGMKVSQALPLLNLIAAEWGLRLNRAKEFKTATKILKKSIKTN